MTDQPQMVQRPHCRKEFPLTEALSRQLEEKIRMQVNADLEKRERDLDSKATDLTKGQQELESLRQSFQQQVTEQVQAQLNAEREKISKEALEKAKSDLGVELEAARSQAADRKTKLEEAQKRELALLKEKQELQLENARKLDAERKAIKEQAIASFQEEQRLKDRQHEETISSMKKTIDDLKRKAEQGSQQAQGEALEVEFENVLKNRFRDDEISPVAKGVRGADILQKVYDTTTHEYCGTILWEAKQARNWSDGWIEKLKGDQREAEADLAVLDALTRMQDELNREKRAMISWWSKREREIEMVINSTAGLYGDLHGILGASLPPIEMLELPAPNDVPEESLPRLAAEIMRKARKKGGIDAEGHR